MISDDLWMERMSRATWPQFATIIGAFFSAVGMGTFLAWLVRPGSDLFTGGSCFAFLIVFMGGYSMWIASATTLMTSHLFKGVWNAFLRFIWGRRQGDLRSAAEGFYRNVSDRERLRDVARGIRRRAVLFRVFGIVVGVVAGLAAGLFCTNSGLFATWTLYALSLGAYGWVLGRLAREGLLPFPAES